MAAAEKFMDTYAVPPAMEVCGTIMPYAKNSCVVVNVTWAIEEAEDSGGVFGDGFLKLIANFK